MILSALNDYYLRLLSDADSGISKPGYSMEKISYAVVLDHSGNVVAVDDIRDTSGKKPTPKDLVVPASFKRPGVGSKPFFLWDKTSYALGVGKQNDRTEQNYSAFKERHQKELAGINDQGLLALLAFLSTWEPQKFSENQNFLAHGEQILDTNVVFKLDGELGYLHERPTAQSLYARLLGNDDASGEGVCLVTGEKLMLARLHPSIKGTNSRQRWSRSSRARGLKHCYRRGRQHRASVALFASAWIETHG